MQRSRPTAAESAQATKLGARLLIVCAALLWSTSGLFAKSEIFAAWPAEERGLLFGFWRAFFAGLLLLPLARQIRFSWRLVPMTSCYAVMNVSFLSALVLTTAANAIWLQATAPLWVFLASLLLFRRRPPQTDWVLAGCCLVGVGWILLHELPGSQRVGVSCGLLSGITYAGVLVCLRWLRTENPVWLIVCNQFVSLLAVLPWILSSGAWRWPTPLQLIVLAGFGLVQMGLPYLLMAQGLRTISSLEAAAISLLEPILMPIWVLLFRGERPSQATFVGACCVFTGLAYKYGSEIWRARRGARDGD